jgi:hypothetical protein
MSKTRRNPAPVRALRWRGRTIEVRDQGEGDCAVSKDFRQIEREIAQATRWVVKWRMLQKEAKEIAGAMGDPTARRHMLFIAEAYRLLAERAKERSVQLARLARHMKKR